MLKIQNYQKIKDVTHLLQKHFRSKWTKKCYKRTVSNVTVLNEHTVMLRNSFNEDQNDGK